MWTNGFVADGGVPDLGLLARVGLLAMQVHEVHVSLFELTRHGRQVFVHVLVDHRQVGLYWVIFSKLEDAVELLIRLGCCELPAVAQDWRLKELAFAVFTSDEQKPAEEGDHPPVESLQKCDVSRDAYELEIFAKRKSSND